MRPARVSSLLCQMLAALLFALLPLSGFAQRDSGIIHGLWVWKTSSALAAPGSAETLRDFCRSEHINHVYLSFSVGASTRGAEDALLAHVIQVLRKAGIRAEALLSSSDADEAGKSREKLLNEIREVVKFNQTHPRDTFDGIHLDIEPQQRPENKGPGNLSFLRGLIQAYRSARQLTEPAHLSIDADIQTKVLKGDLDQRRSLLTSLPRLTLMLYELSSPGDGETLEQKEAKLRSNSDKYMAMAYDGVSGPGLARLAIGLRTPDYDQELPRMLRTMEDTLRTNPHYLGWAWHSWNDRTEATADGPRAN
jgi:hypothetical protein